MSKQTSISSFFNSPTKGKRKIDAIDLTTDETNKMHVKPKSIESKEEKISEKIINLVSWNTDGLDVNLIQERASEIVSIILSLRESDTELPLAIFLQEVIPETFHIFKQRFMRAGYQCLPDQMPNAPYFTAAFFRQPITVDAVLRENFSQSTMGRDMIVMQGELEGTPLLLLTSHLESLSGDANSAERSRQFQLMLERLVFFEDGLALFCGDTNLREKEVKKEPLVKQVKDAWEEAGSSKDKKYTWDLALNTNKQMSGGSFKPRMRLDRCYLNKAVETQIQEFKLLGTSKMAEGVFPSDHFGLHIRLKIAS